MKTYYPIKDFELLDPNGTNIMGGSYCSHDESMYINYPKHYDNDQNLHLYIYRYPFSMDPVSSITKGQIAEYLPLCSRDRLRIRTGPAETSSYYISNISIRKNLATTGSYRLTYRGFKTDVLAYNATASAIALAIEALEPFKYNATDVTVSAALSADNITITYGGQLAEEEKEELIFVESMGINDGTNDLFYNSTLTTEHVRGFPSGSGSYVVNVVGVQMQRARSDVQGKLQVFSS